jgi:hypothetical protein
VKRSQQFNCGSVERSVHSARRDSDRKSEGIGPCGCAPPRDAAISQQSRRRKLRPRRVAGRSAGALLFKHGVVRSRSRRRAVEAAGAEKAKRRDGVGHEMWPTSAVTKRGVEEPPSLARRLRNAEIRVWGWTSYFRGEKSPRRYFAPRRHSLSRGFRMPFRGGTNIGDLHLRAVAHLSLSAWCKPRVGAFGRAGLFPELASSALRTRSASKPRDAQRRIWVFDRARYDVDPTDDPSGSVRNPASGYATVGRNTCRAEFRRRM